GSGRAAASADGEPAENSQRLAAADIDGLPVPEHWNLAESVVRQLILTALISLFGAALVTAQKGRDEGQYTIGVDVDLVVFNITVTDGKGRHVSGLKAGDFHVLEGSRLQDVKLFIAEDVPVSVGLIIDNSGSMRDKHADVTLAALEFAGASNPQDEMF